MATFDWRSRAAAWVAAAWVAGACAHAPATAPAPRAAAAPPSAPVTTRGPGSTGEPLDAAASPTPGKVAPADLPDSYNGGESTRRQGTQAIGRPGVATKPAARPAPALPPSPPGTVGRWELNAVLDRGPAAFLQRVGASAEARHGHFYGWRIGGAVAGIPVLRAGDVVVEVNGSRLERPEEFIECWEAARFASEITVQLERGEAVMRLRWPVVAATPPATLPYRPRR